MPFRDKGPVQITIVHADLDRGLGQDLVKHLAVPTASDALKVWACYQVEPGEDIDVELALRVYDANLILLIVTKELFASPRFEPLLADLPELRKRARIVPVIAEACYWRASTVSHFQQVPFSGLPVLSHARSVDEAWADIATAVHLISDVMLAARNIEPEPHYPDPATRDLVREFNRFRQLRKETAQAGQDPSYFEAKVEEIRLRLRAQGQLKAGYLLDDRFRLLAAIGQGGFGQVWTAFDEHRQIILAVKVLHSHLAAPGDPVRGKFERGARQMAALDHPAIVRVLDPPAEDSGYVYYTMEYLDGGDLRQCTQADRLEFDEKLEIFFKVASALELAHQRGIVHRDVKPANIVLTSEKEPKLTDFDLVRTRDSLDETPIRGGPTSFTAPEARDDAWLANEQSDVYSLGMTMLSCLYEAELPAAKILHEPEKFLETLLAGEVLRKTLGKAIERDEKDRWPSISDFQQAVRDAILSDVAQLKDVSFGIEVGSHTAAITQIGVDEAGRFLVTASRDKTIRIWDLQSSSAAQLRVLRPPSGSGPVGALRAVAISPDGRWIAGASQSAADGIKECIHLFDRTSGEILRQLDGLTSGVNDLAFSLDGSRLAAVLDGVGGLKVFRARDGKTLDHLQADRPKCAAYTRELRLAIAGLDGFIRLFDPAHRPLAKVKARSGTMPFRLAFSPSGKQLAVAYFDAPILDIFSTSDLKWISSFKAADPDSIFFSVSWSADGQHLYAGGGNQATRRSTLSVWEDPGRGSVRDISGPTAPISAIHPLSRGRLVFSTMDSGWGILAGDGKTRFVQNPCGANFWATHGSFRTDPTGKEIHFSFKLGEPATVFSIPRRTLSTDSVAKNHHGPRIQAAHLQVEGWRDSVAPTLNGTVLPLLPDEYCRSLAIAANGQFFILGTDRFLRLFDREGKSASKQHVPESAWVVNFTRGGQLILAALGDGTIRYFRAIDGQELLAFFPHVDGRRWVMWTPTGYFDLSPDGQELFGWHVNRGSSQAGNFLHATKFWKHFYRPAVIDHILDTLDEGAAVRRAEGSP